MRSYSGLALLVLLLFFHAGTVLAAGTDADTAAPPQEARPTVTKALKASDMMDPSSFYVDEKLFASPLPILVLELEGGEALGPAASLRVYDRSVGDNTLADVPASTALIDLQERRDSPSNGKTT